MDMESLAVLAICFMMLIAISVTFPVTEEVVDSDTKTTIVWSVFIIPFVIAMGNLGGVPLGTSLLLGLCAGLVHFGLLILFWTPDNSPAISINRVPNYLRVRKDQSITLINGQSVSLLIVSTFTAVAFHWFAVIGVAATILARYFAKVLTLQPATYRPVG